MSQRELRITMLGEFELAWGDGRTQEIFTHDLPEKRRALLGYLLLNRRLHNRENLAELFWPDSQNPLASLRVALNKLRVAGLEPFLEISRLQLGFNFSANYWFDLQAFDALLTKGKRSNTPDIAALKKAVSIYRGEFLHGFSIPDITVFDNDIRRIRQNRDDRVWEALEIIILDSMKKPADYEIGIQYARRALALTPWRETAHRYLMWLLAHTGQIPAAIKQYERCREALEIHVEAGPSPETELLLDEIRQHKTTAELEIVTLPPLDAAAEPSPPFWVPGQRPYFVDRTGSEADLATALLANDGAQRWGIVGMGGIGKTTLALHLAHRLRSHFPDGVLWASLVDAQPEEIATQWASAYGYDLSQQRSGMERLHWLRQLLAQKQALLIFDDVRVAAKIRGLLPKESACAVLITSRDERVVRSLGAQPVSLSQFSLENGRRLLLHHVQDDRAIAEPDVLDELCQLVGNHPLALSIVGGYLAHRPYRSLADFAYLLGQRLAPLNLAEDATPLRETFELSWAHLEARQSELFGLIGLFNGRSFSLKTIAALAEISLDSREDMFQFEDQLQLLVQLSLLQDEGGQRYRQHTLLANLAQEKLTPDAAVPAQKRYTAYFADFAAAHVNDYMLLQQEWANLDEAIRLAEANELWLTVLQFTAVLKHAWFTRGRFEEARHAFELAFRAAIRLEDDPQLARNWLWWGQACLEQGDQNEARKWLEEALNLYNELEDGIGIADAEFELARLDIDQTLTTQAEQRLERVLALRREQGDEKGIAAAEYRYARIRHRQSQYEEAQQLADQALTRQQAEGDQLGRCRTLRLLVFIMIGLAQREVAYQYAREVLALAESLGDLGEIAMAQKAVASVCRVMGQLEEANLMAEKSLQGLEQMGDRRSINDVRFLQCLIRRTENNFTAAEALAEDCRREFLHFKDELYAAYCLVHLGDFRKAAGDVATAVRHWQDALVLAKKLKNEEMIQKIQARLDSIA